MKVLNVREPEATSELIIVQAEEQITLELSSAHLL